jgi:hypothetical protein
MLYDSQEMELWIYLISSDISSWRMILSGRNYCQSLRGKRESMKDILDQYERTVKANISMRGDSTVDNETSKGKVN